ncbi:MAG: hypothetical protein ACTIJ6_05455 [Leucobacter sp.]
MNEKVPVLLTGKFAWKLFRLAEHRGISVEALILEAVLSPKPVAPNASEETRSKIRRLVLEGMDDGSIATTIDRSRGYVSDVRRGYGLKPNRKAY